MKTFLPLLLIAHFFASCATNDLKAVYALYKGMSRDQANSKIESYGFKIAQSLSRPSSGWPQENPAQAPIDLAGRAQAQEAKLGVRISKADYYPVGHGLSPKSDQLFLFYGPDGKLIEFHRQTH